MFLKCPFQQPLNCWLYKFRKAVRDQWVDRCLSARWPSARLTWRCPLERALDGCERLFLRPPAECRVPARPAMAGDERAAHRCHGSRCLQPPDYRRVPEMSFARAAQLLVVEIPEISLLSMR
jgi:hypothetical protein